MNFFAFWWRAIVAGIVVGAAAPAIGTFVVQKKLSLLGDGVGHIAFAGVTLGLWLEISPLGAALVLAILGAIALDRVRRRAPEDADMVLALFFYGSIGTGVVVSSLSGTFNPKLLGVLFGQLVTVTTGELLAMCILGLGVVAVVALLYRGLLATAIDEEAAWVAGVPVNSLNVVLMVAAATMIGVGMRVVGILMIAALMVLPVGVARNLARSFRATLLTASAVGAVSAVIGIYVSDRANSAPGGTIVLTVCFAFAASDIVRRVRASASRRRGLAARARDRSARDRSARDQETSGA